MLSVKEDSSLVAVASLSSSKALFSPFALEEGSLFNEDDSSFTRLAS